MAVGEMGDFLKKYYRHLHANQMAQDPGVLAQLVEDKNKGLLTGHQQEWFENFLEPDPDSPYGYKAKAVPDPLDTNELSRNDLRKLYEGFALAIAGMKGNSIYYDTVKDASALNFVQQWFDERKVFSIPQATDECNTGIKNIVELLKEDGKNDDDKGTIKNIKQVIIDETFKKDDGSKDKLFDDIPALEKFLSKCEKGEYNTDTKVQDKIKKVARTLDEYLNSYSYESEESTKQKNKNYLGKVADELAIVRREEAFSNIKIDDAELEDFGKLYAKDLLDNLYYDKSVREKFREHDEKKITDWIDKAEKKINYQNKESDDYVKPKIEDELSAYEQLQKWATDTYSDTFKKYEELRGGHLFFSPYAKEIFKAIDKEKVKPTDGLSGLLGKSADIKKRLGNKTVAQHFDWFVETMNGIKDEIPKAIDGAWKDAKKMRCVVTHIILKATDPKNTDPDAMVKAKTAMEIMTAMKYGMLTSNVMDALKKEEFKLFSDGQLSWNKNEGIQFVTKAFDKSLKAAFLGVGYGITFVRNKIMLSGRRGSFNNAHNQNKGALASRFQQEKNRLMNARHTSERYHAHRTPEDLKKIGDRNKELEDLDKKDGINKDTLGDRKKDAEAIKGNMKKYAADRASHEEAYKRYEENKKIIDQDPKEHKKLDDYKDALDEINKKVKEKEDELKKADTYKDIEEEAAKNAMAAQLMKELNDLKDQQKKAQEDYNTQDELLKSPEYRDALAKAKIDLVADEKEHKDYIDAGDEYDKAKKSYDDLNSKIDRFNDATKEIQELNAAIDKRKNALDSWEDEHSNKVLELENYWNFLQTGATKTWRISTKRAQEKFNKKLKEGEYADFVRRKGLEY